MNLPKHFKSTRLDEEDIDLNLFDWTDRDSYLAWVANWKALIKQQIADIRRMKTIYRDPANTDVARAMAQSERHYLRIYCANLFLLRRMAKQMSAEQRKSRLAA